MLITYSVIVINVNTVQEHQGLPFEDIPVYSV